MSNSNLIYDAFKPNKIMFDIPADQFLQLLHHIRRQILLYSTKRPILSLGLIITTCVLLLPIITATALMPIVLLLEISNFLSTKGTIYVFYTVFIQGVILFIMVLVLFLAAFAIATSASVLHSYNFKSNDKKIRL